jgi:hypothetical protein
LSYLLKWYTTIGITLIYGGSEVKKLIQIIATAILGIGLSAATVSADSVTCGSISTTGQDSTNTVTCVDSNKVDVSCNNNVVVDNNNDQTSNSGTATSSGNTEGGSATSGNSSNSNTATVSVGASCAPVAGTSQFTTTPSGGKGAGAVPAATVSATTPAAAPAAAALPDTGSNTLLDGAIASLVVLGSALTASRLGLFAFRRVSLK